MYGSVYNGGVDFSAQKCEVRSRSRSEASGKMKARLGSSIGGDLRYDVTTEQVGET